ncbi:MAG TPA: hypothetical protein VKV02_11835, partial [Acidobacteriaceae bacterium]|nr:hypothetical protein [Acidobacteriaceae bacterium]
MGGSTGATGSTGSTGATGSTGTTGGVPGPGFSGRVLAGNVPLNRAQVQIFAAGTASNGSAPTQLLTAALPTDPTGAFSVAAGSFNCPAAGSVLYLLATGGTTGTGSGNAGTELMTVLGACNSLSSPTFTVNEFTTVASVFALRPFLGRGGQLGYPASNVGGFQLALATISRLASLATGTAALGFPANGAAPTRKMNSLANLLNACVASASTSNAGCSSLFLNTSGAGVPVSNTLDAALAIANAPGTNVASLFALSQAANGFSPALASAPPDWTLAVPFTGGGMNGPTAVSVDSTGRVWVANYFGVASLFANSGLPLIAGGFTGDGLQESYGGAVDA